MITSLIAVVTYSVTAIALICYQRDRSGIPARYRPEMSFLAYVMIVSSGAIVIDILFNNAYVKLCTPVAGTFLMILSLKSKGNAAEMVDMVGRMIKVLTNTIKKGA